MVNKLAKGFAGKEEPLEDIIPLVLMELTASLLTEANQLFNFNEDLGAGNVSETEVVPCSEEAVKVLKEANLAAENAIRDRFPSLPEIPP